MFRRIIFDIPKTNSVQYIEGKGDLNSSLENKYIRLDEPFGTWDELTILRHIYSLTSEDFCVDKNFYPLGSCTMKYNPKICEELANLDVLTSAHPHLITEDLIDKIQFHLQILYEMDEMLSILVGMARFTFQPMAGANGEFCGLSIMKAYFNKKCEDRDWIIIPDSAHGTNPASASMLGFKVKVVPTKEKGYLSASDIEDMLDERCAGLMLTCPNTLGLFNPEIRRICDIVHRWGGLVYYDGANFNALMGRVKPLDLGFDIVHLNLHKSFSTPHGSGGPGSGPVGVVEKLVQFLPVPMIEKKNDKFILIWDMPDSIGKIAPFFGNFLVVVRAYVYLKLLGIEGLRLSSGSSVLNANYLMERLKDVIDIPYSDRRCMHEFVASAERLKKEVGISAMDIAKALIDKGIHPPTVYFPLIVKEALMIEPTETESKFVLDNFVEAISEIIKNPQETKSSPKNRYISRPDEVRAVRKPILSDIN